MQLALDPNERKRLLVVQLGQIGPATGGTLHSVAVTAVELEDARHVGTVQGDGSGGVLQRETENYYGKHQLKLHCLTGLQVSVCRDGETRRIYVDTN